jgi:peptide/nickel transport system permease protein
MLRFLMRRAILALLVCLTVLVISFALTRLSGDLAISIAGPNATAQDIEIIRKNYGLDRRPRAISDAPTSTTHQLPD